MLHGIIVCNQTNGHNEHKVKRFLEEAPLLDMELTTVVNDGTVAKIEDGNAIIDLKCDFIIYLDKDIYLAKLLESKGYKVFNDSNFIRLCDDKILTYISLVNKGINMPKTYSAPLIFDDSLNEGNYNFLTKIGNDLGYPLVVKRAFGSLGQGVFLAHDLDELKKIYSENFNQPLLFQKYIQSSYGKTYRIIIIDGKIFGAFMRVNKSDFRSNFGVTASSQKIKLNEKEASFARKIADLLQIKYAGIDVMFDEKGEPILCEINSNAFFEEFEKVTKLNVAKAYLEMIKNNL